jgi:signal transduction histidine kinase
MNPFSISCLLIFLTALPLGYFVYIQNTKQWANKMWFLYSIAICFWGFFGMMIGLTDDPVNALIYWRIAMGLGIIWMPVLFYHFAYLYAPWNEKKTLITAYVITFLLSVSAFTPLYIPRVEWIFGSIYWSRPGITFYILTIWWFVLTGYSHTKLLLSSKGMPKERQNQIKYFIGASAVGYLGGLHDFSVSYGLNIYPWLNFSVVLYPFIMTYAIIKHGMFDIFIYVRKVFYSAVGIGLIAWIIGSVGVVDDYIHERFGFSHWVIPIVAGMVSVYVIYLFLNSARKADKAKQEFITIAAHKLRTPLTHIHYIAEELKQATTKEETDALVVNLGESTELLIGLVNKVMDLSNLEVQSEKYEFTSVNLKTITDDVVKNTIALVQHKKINLNVNIEDNFPDVEGYEKSLKFVVQSLFENAVIYTPEGGNIEVRLYTDKKNVVWSIKDSGIGIAKEDLDKIFEKFFRTQNALKTDTEGTGLALSISRNLIKRQGGDIHIESAGIGQGTKFWFTLPRK